MKIKNDWLDHIGGEFDKEYYRKLRAFLIREYRERTIYPRADDIFNAFHLTPYSSTKLVILGQDPYHGPNQAHGLSFSVKSPTKPPPSLMNIFREIEEDLSYPIPNNGDLTSWAQQGVLLLNTVLTVRKGQAHSHKNMGWEIFTDQVIRSLNNKEKPIVFLLWGRPAQSKARLIDKKHYILEAPHPSPLSAYRGFFGSRHFSRSNEILESLAYDRINWKIDNI